MFVQKQKLQSTIGWSCNLTEQELEDPSVTFSVIYDFKTQHMGYVSDPIYSDWFSISSTLPKMPDFEINANNEIIRTFYWNDEASMNSASITMDALDAQYIAAGGSIPYVITTLEEYTI
ncbi:MAG: hypothetical protein RLZZ337_1523 [Bacteroidota bacterium]|jgi:hypothetical protein